MKKELKLNVEFNEDPFREDFLIFEHAPENQPNSLSDSVKSASVDLTNDSSPKTASANASDPTTVINQPIGEPGNVESTAAPIYFSLHVDHHDEALHSPIEPQKVIMPQNNPVKEEAPISEQKDANEDLPALPKVSPTQNNKTTFKDLLKQLVAAVVFLAIGYLLLNFPATWKIAKSKLAEITDSKTRTPLEDFIDTDTNSKDGSLIANDDQSNAESPGNLGGGALDIVDDNSVLIEGRKRDIPAIDMEISPLSNRLIIPRISENVPVVRVSSENLLKRDWGALEKDIQKALQNGVVHYPGTSLPNQSGNVVITGHSSYFPWDAGRFKDVFALLHDVVIGDRIVLFYNQKKYVYEVDNIKVVLPKDIEILKQTPFDQLTLITCTPVGTNLKRLIVTARPVSVENINDGRVVR